MSLSHSDLLCIVLAFAWIIGMTILGTVICVTSRVKFCSTTNECATNKLKISRVIGELSVSGLIGIITYAACSSADFDPILTAAISGTLGHVGAHSLHCLELSLR